MKQEYHFSIRGTRFLDHEAKAVRPLPDWAEPPGKLVEFYKMMVLTRTFDQKAVALQRTGQLGTYASSLGQEALGVAIGFAMKDTDVFAPNYRDHAAQIIRGVSITELLLFWGGDERGSATTKAREDLPICVPVATQCTHAAGVAGAIKIRGVKRAVVTTCGDGAKSRGDFLESINLAGAWKLPLVFVVNNNQWAISVPRGIQSSAETLAQKAIGAGIPGEQVDGNDVIALYEALREALQRAYAGKGASLIEALTYRLGDHTTADDAARYRPAEELNRAWEREPLKRLQTYLHSRGAWDEEQEKALQDECQARVQASVDEYLATEPEAATAIFGSLHENLPHALEEQYEKLVRKSGRIGDA